MAKDNHNIGDWKWMHFYSTSLLDLIQRYSLLNSKTTVLNAFMFVCCYCTLLSKLKRNCYQQW